MVDVRLSLRVLFCVLLAGALWLPVSVGAQTEPAASDSGVTIHVVQRGENLFRIAQGYGLTVEELARMNGITDPSNILVGQRLLVPGGVITVGTPPTHIVQAGETLRSIAELYGLTIEELAAANDIVNWNTIYIGQVLTLGAAPSIEAGDLSAAVEAAQTPLIEPTALIETALPVMTPVPAATEAGAADSDIGIMPTAAVEVAAVVPGQSLVHIVQQGETLYSIAQPYGLTVNELARANSITDPTFVYVGQQLMIPGFEPVQAAYDLPEPLTSFEISPLVLIEGKTGRFRLTSSAPVNVTARFLDRILTAATDPATGAMNILVGVPIFTEPGVYPLSLSVTGADGTFTEFDTNVQVVAGGYGSEYITLPQDRVRLLAPEIEQAELSVMAGIMLFNANRYFDGPMGLPAAAAMNDPFGRRRSYNGGPYDRYHMGADFAAAPGANILAAANGQVVAVDTLNIRGLITIIDHGWGVYSAYSHQSEAYVAVGDMVTTGQTIGAVGSSGRVTGAHLHWEVWVNGVPVDPLQWVRESFL